MLSLLIATACLAAGALSTEPNRAAWDLDFISTNASLPKVM